jgi:hypothetical protein
MDSYIRLEKTATKVFFIAIVSLLFIISPRCTHAAALSIAPSSGTFEVGNRVSLKVIATSSVPFNAVSGILSYPASVFSVESVSKAGSILNFWVTEPTLVTANNTIKFEGVSLGGFLGSSGTVITVNLRAAAVGSGSFSFQSGQILANDGEGTDITGNMVGGNFTVKEATLKKPALPTPTPLPQPEIEQPAPSLLPPEIMLGTKYGAKAIVGKSNYGAAQVLVTFLAQDGVKVFILGNSELDGTFSLLVPSSLRRGEYSVSAVVIREDKTNSEASNIIKIRIGSIFSDLGWEVSILILLLILAIIYLILRTYLHINRHSDAERLVHKSFDILREDLNDSTKATFKKDINDAEKVITKKINSIE